MHRSLLLLAIAVSACRPTGHPANAAISGTDSSRVTSEITAQLSRAAADWNRGDLDAFLSDYAAESTTTFVDGRRARYGIGFIRGNYARRFIPGAKRDSLSFEEIAVRSLSPSLALVTARYILERNGQVTASGPFTLVMEHRDEGWKILHDHSSSDPRQ